MTSSQQDFRWPPLEWEDVYTRYRAHAAWYSGIPERIEAHYRGDTKRFWGRSPNICAHVPLPADIATISASLLFSEPIDISISESNDSTEAGQAEERLLEITREIGLDNMLAEAAETASALGGVFLAVAWDREELDVPFVRVIQADAAIPIFRWGRLRQVTFWRNVTPHDVDSQTVWRHLEVYSRGRIEHGLFRGTESTLGARLPLEAHPETADLEDEVILPGELANELLAWYIPNLRPNPEFRGDPIGGALGKSDYDGIETLLDSLDATFSSWLRDIEFGKARLVVPERFLEQEATQKKNKNFSVESEIFTQLDIDPEASQGNTITQVQFGIRSQDHLAAANALIERIITAAGYAPQTLGLNVEGLAQSGTALRIRERRSLMTRGKKEGYWKAPVADVLRVLLIADREIFGNRIATGFTPRVEFGDTITPDPEETARTVELLNRAEAISTETKVRTTHPEWTEDEVNAEVERIQQEAGMAPSPMEIGME